MSNYDNKITNLISLKYKFSDFNSKFISVYFKQLEKNLIKYSNYKKNYHYQKKLNSTENFLFKTLNKKLSKNDKKKIIVLFKKFNAHLKLKASYNEKFIKKNDKECHIRAYLFLGSIIGNIKEISLLHNLNCLLKIQDIISVNTSKLNNFEKFLFRKLIINILKKIKKIYVY